jgi:hypothetical protein
LFFFKDDDHLALYGRAQSYTALKQFDDALIDAARVVTLKPQWIKVRLKNIQTISFDFLLGSFMSK